MTNTVSVKEKYSLEGQYIDPLIGDVVESNGTFALISNLDLMNGDPDLVQKALKQVYDSLYDYQVSEEAMAALGPAAAPVINLSNFYKWVYSSGATDSELQKNFIKVLQALLTPGSWKLPSTDSNLPFENHSYPMYSDDNDGFVSIGVYLGLGEIDENDSTTIEKLDLNLIVNHYKEYKKNFQDLKTYLEKGTITWTELKNKVDELVNNTLNLSKYLGDPQYGGLYPNQGKEFESYSKSLEILSEIMGFWAKNGGATLATTKQFFTLDPSNTYQKYEENYLFAAANARQKVVMIGGEDQLTAALLQDLIIKRGKVLEECTLDLNTVQIYTEYNGATDLMSKAHNNLNTIMKLCDRIYESAVSDNHKVQDSTFIRAGGEDSVSWAYILEFSSKKILKLFSGNSISKGNAENLKNALLSIKYTYSYRPEPWKGSVNVSVNSQESFANSLHRMQENNIGTALKGAIDDETGGDWNMLYDPLEALEAQLNLIIDYYSKEDAVKALEKKYGANNVEGLKNSIEFSLDNAQKNYDEALGYYERLTAPVEYDRLLSLVLMYNPLDGTGQRVTALTKNTDGTYTATLSQGESTSEFSLRDCEERMSLPYFALAMCYEKMVVVETVIRAHAEEIKDLNAEIIENNNWLKYANGAYQNYYSWAIYSKNGVYADNSSRLWKVISIKAGTTISDENVAMESAKAFLGYLKEECGIKGIDAEKIVHWGDYNTKGEFQKGGDTFNIDVEEQGFLTLISNWQEALRQRGDWLSTESQKKTLELTQDFQIYNSACSITSQVCKMVGGPNDAIASNIR